ncbi:MAG: hydrogenase maturation nickel metallochaperone HypA [Maribacter sp.]|nr:hydrogenase maturation nickel metallochaperone HypA [Maribacter sp.]
MHELSVALGIVRIAENEMAKVDANEVELIELEIGTLAGIEFDSLDFVWPSAVKDTVLEKAEKRINKIPAKARCGDCEKIYPIEFIHDNCQYCGSFLKSIVQGKELRVVSLETF